MIQFGHRVHLPVLKQRIRAKT